MNGVEKSRFLGIPYKTTEVREGYTYKRKFFGLIKKKENDKNKYYSILGMNIFKSSRGVDYKIEQVNNNLKKDLQDLKRKNDALKKDVLDLKKNNESIKKDVFDSKDGVNSMRSFVYFTHLAKSIHPLVFSKYKDVNKGKDVVLYACGPTAKYYSKIENACHIGVNRALYNSNIHFDVLFMHDREFVIENIELIKNYNVDKFCAFHTLGRNARKFNVSSKDISYINAKRFLISDPSFKNIDSNIPDVINPDITSGMLYDRGGGTVFSALQFILYTNPRRIFLVGCDCTDGGYFYSVCNNKDSIPSHWHDPREGRNILLPNTIKLWNEFKSIADMLYPHIGIVSINPIGLKGLFYDVYTQDYIDDNPGFIDDYVEILNYKGGSNNFMFCW